MADTTKVLIVDVQLPAVKERADELQKIAESIENLKKKQDELIESGQKNTAQFQANKAELKGLTAEYTKGQNELLKYVKASQSADGSLDQMQASVAVLKVEWNAMSEAERTNSVRGKELSAEIERLNTKINETKLGVNDSTSNIGKYSQATMSLRQEIRTLTQTLAEMEITGKGNSQEFKMMVQRLGQLKDTMQDVQGRAKFFADDARWITAASQAVQGLVGAYSIYKGITALVGAENKELEKTMMKLQALMSIMMGMKQVENMLNKDSAVRVGLQVLAEKARLLFTRQTTAAIVQETAATQVNTVATQAGTVATEASNKASKSTPWGLIIGLIVAAAVALWGYISALTKQSELQKAIADAQKEGAKAAMDEKIAIEQLLRKARDMTATYGERQKAIEELNKISPEYLGNITQENINTNAATLAIGAYIDSINRKAKAQAYATLLSAKYQEQAEELALRFENFPWYSDEKLMGEKWWREQQKIKLDKLQEEIDAYNDLINVQNQAGRAVVRGCGGSTTVSTPIVKPPAGATKEIEELDEQIKILISDFDNVEQRYLKWIESQKDGTNAINESTTEIEEMTVVIQSHVDAAIELSNKLNQLQKKSGQYTLDWIKSHQSQIDAVLWGLNSMANALGQYYDYKNAKEKESFDLFEKSQDTQRKSLQDRLSSQSISQSQYDREIARLDEEKDKRQRHMERDAAKRAKTMALINAGIQGAMAILAAYVGGVEAGGPSGLAVGAIFAAVAAAFVALQIGLIAATPLPPAARGRLSYGPSHAAGGEAIEVEGGEATLSRRATQNSLPYLDLFQRQAGGQPFINDGGYSAAMAAAKLNGNGMTASDLAKVKIYVSVDEFNRVSNRVKAIQARATT